MARCAQRRRCSSCCRVRRAITSSQCRATVDVVLADGIPSRAGGGSSADCAGRCLRKDRVAQETEPSPQPKLPPSRGKGRESATQLGGGEGVNLWTALPVRAARRGAAEPDAVRVSGARAEGVVVRRWCARLRASARRDALHIIRGSVLSTFVAFARHRAARDHARAARATRLGFPVAEPRVRRRARVPDARGSASRSRPAYSGSARRWATASASVPPSAAVLPARAFFTGVLACVAREARARHVSWVPRSVTHYLAAAARTALAVLARARHGVSALPPLTLLELRARRGAPDCRAPGRWMETFILAS